jgi:hypothetical protein
MYRCITKEILNPWKMPLLTRKAVIHFKQTIMQLVKQNRSQWLHIRLSEHELEELKRRSQKTTCRNLNDYARRILLHQQFTTYTRNQSLDEFLAAMIELRNGLQTACEDFHAVVEKLQTLEATPDIKLLLYGQQKAQLALLRQVETIQDCITKT